MEKSKKEFEEKEQEQLKRQNSRRKNEAKRIKAKERRMERIKKIGLTEIDQRFHQLVGKYKYRLKIPGNGNCQCGAKAACLMGDPSAGPDLATQENGYIVEHWEGYFQNFFSFPQTLLLGGGKTLTVKNQYEFLEFLVLNPDASHMWADHHQLQVTANLYNTTVQVLTIDERGNGSLLYQPFRPDPRLADYALLPATKPNGEKMEVEEVWLLYTGGNHYDALIAEDGVIMTLGTIGNLEKDSYLEELLDVAKEVEKSEEKSSVTEPRNIQKEDTDINTKLNQEIKNHNETKKILQNLEIEYKNCKQELRIVSEEKERLKIERNDLKKINSVSKHIQKDQSRTTNKTVKLCAICEYPFKSINDLTNHQSKHKSQTFKVDETQNCGICGEIYGSNNEFRKHITIKHSTQHNCTNVVSKDHQI